ncbi:MAG: crossover junction endodeoxyribonuclease RuvC [Nocardioidaceae bacterium]|nr:crossover junction endodeoxyribonuclease RuvC [Nocardioidaceae bacterium]MDQ3166373.1 crossover junction endodeoxyribonuclease RuvC [Actinomycetota bacterium]
MRVLGVDPGLTRCGLGVVEGAVGRPLALVGVTVVRTAAALPVAQRLVQLERTLVEWLDAYRPDAVAVERVFSQHNVRTVMGTAQASGVALVVAARAGIPVALHTPSEVKAAITGSGRADKAQVAAMVTRLLRLSTPPRPADTTDALALAICHLWRGPAIARLEGAIAGTRGSS